MKSEKGSITLFVLIAMIFFLTIAFTAYASASSKLQGQNSELERIQASYGQDLSEEGLASLYDELTSPVGKYAAEVLKTDENASAPEKKSPYVEYDGNLYRVLYDSSSQYGIELISNTTVSDPVVLGKNDPTGNNITGAGELGSNERAIWSYTNAIETLNKAAEARVNTSDGVVSDVRCVGSRPENKNFKITEKYSNTLTPNTNSSYFPEKYNGLWERGEGVYGESDGGWVIDNQHNYTEDLNRMETLSIRTTGEAYWLASRSTIAVTSYTRFDVRFIHAGGGLYHYYLFYVNSGGNIGILSPSYGVRPVCRLSPGVKITGGEGTEASPYTLGL